MHGNQIADGVAGNDGLADMGGTGGTDATDDVDPIWEMAGSTGDFNLRDKVGQKWAKEFVSF